MVTETLNRGFAVDLIFLDFAKAFDKVSHSGLLAKLQAYGFDDKTVAWILSFLSNRQQRVVLDDFKSDWNEVLSGVPQGSVLGPLLFTVFINDMPKLTTHPCKLFADDSKLVGIIKNDLDSQNLQEDLNKLVKWSTDWRMLFNPDKCKVMHIGQEKTPKFPNSVPPTTKRTCKRIPREYTIFDSSTNTTIPLAKTTQERDLGITITNDIKWHTQAKIAANKATRAMGMLKRTFKHWDIQSFKTLYCSTVRPHLEYASTAWSPHMKQDIKTLERVQRQATKVIRSIAHLPYDQRLKIVGLTRLSIRRDRGDAIQYFNCKNNYNYIAWHHINTLSNSLSSTGPARGIRGKPHRIIRQLIKNCPPRDNFFSNRVAKIWNSLPEEVVNAGSINAFKNRYDKHHGHPTQ
jgi:hypothetical protein